MTGDLERLARIKDLCAAYDDRELAEMYHDAKAAFLAEREKNKRLEEALADLSSGRAIAGVPLWFHDEEHASSATSLWREIQAMRQLAAEALAASVPPGESEADEDGDDLPACCELARATGESHYHCGNCGEVSGMMGHYVPSKGGFVCSPGESEADE